MNRYGIVVIGCGYIGQQHLDDIYYRDNVHLIGVVDTDPARAALFAARYGAEHWATDYRSLVALPETQIVIIASWVRSHCEILRFCIEAGKHVLCEKPLSADKEESEQAFRLIASSKVKVQLGLILRHNHSYQRLREIIAGGAIGTPNFIRMVQNHHALNWPRYRRLLEDCPSFFDCGIHYYDIAAWLTGSRIQSIHCSSAFLDTDCEHANYGIARMRTESGCLAIYESGWSKKLPAASERLFVGTEGYLQLTLAHERVSAREEGDLITLYRADPGIYETINLPCVYKNMYAQLCSLIQSIETDSETVPALSDAQAATRVAFAAIQSAESNSEVSL